MQAVSGGPAHFSHDPFLLNNAKVASRRRGLDQTMRGVSLEQAEYEWLPKSSWSLRSTVWRIIGGLAIVGASWLLFLITTQPEARRAVIDWVTFGIGAPDRSGDQDVPKGDRGISNP
jgi:hypothetical protein